MTQLDYDTTFWLNYNGLSQASTNKLISFGNLGGDNFLSSFYIGNQQGMNFYRKEEVKRAVQTANLRLLSIRNQYDQTLFNLAEVTTKSTINKFSFTDNSKTAVIHKKLSEQSSDIVSARQVPIEMTFGFFEEANQITVELYNITQIYIFGGA
jgi:hypothetical protein